MRASASTHPPVPRRRARAHIETEAARTALCSRVPSQRQAIDNWTPAVARRVIGSTPKRVSVLFKIFFRNYHQPIYQCFPGVRGAFWDSRRGSAKIGGVFTSFDVRRTQSAVKTAGPAVEKAVYLSCRASDAQNVRFPHDFVCFAPETGRKSRWVISAAIDP